MPVYVTLELKQLTDYLIKKKLFQFHNSTSSQDKYRKIIKIKELKKTIKWKQKIRDMMRSELNLQEEIDQ